MAQDHGLCRKKVSQKPAHGPPLQARVAAANRTVLQLANCWFDPGAHGMNRGQSKMNGARTMRRAVGMAWQRRAGTQPAEQATTGGHSRRILRPAQASRHTASSWPASQQKQQLPTMLAGLSPCSAGRWGECSGAGSQEGGRRPTYGPYPTYHLCLSLSLPTPLICTNPI